MLGRKVLAVFGVSVNTLLLVFWNILLHPLAVMKQSCMNSCAKKSPQC